LLIMSEISISQSHLSEELQLLIEFGYSDFDMPYQSVRVRSDKDMHELETHSDMCMLELIATCLTTGILATLSLRRLTSTGILDLF
jgi:hypothetical protein